MLEVEIGNSIIRENILSSHYFKCHETGETFTMINEVKVGQMKWTACIILSNAF